MSEALNSTQHCEYIEVRCIPVKPFVVFSCLKCRNFTNAPVGQKRRRCSYCGHIIDISKASLALFDSPDAASLAVKQFNAARGGEEFDMAVERSRERIRALVPEERIGPKDLVDDSRTHHSTGKRKRLLMLLEKEALHKPCTLGHIEELSSKYHLDWSWVEEQLTKLSNQGIVIFPRPWSVQLVQTAGDKKEDATSMQDVTKEIIEFLRRRGSSVEVRELIVHFKEQGVATTAVESSLERLMKSDVIYQPKPREVKLL